MGEFKIQSERLKLKSFHYWVTFGGTTGILISCVAVFQLILSFIVLSVVAAGFSVYILRTLIELEKRGWVVAYTILVGIPFLLALILSFSEVVGLAIFLFPLVMFYVYCWILRYSVTDWLSDLGDEKAFEQDQKNEKFYQDILERFQ